MDTEMTVERTPSDLLSPRERAREAAIIIATAIARLNATCTRERDIPLGFSAPESVHTNPSPLGV